MPHIARYASVDVPDRRFGRGGPRAAPDGYRKYMPASPAVVSACNPVVVQIVEHSIIGTRSAVVRLRRPGTELQFVVFPMFHVASPQFYADVSERLRRCDLLVVEGVSGRSVLGCGAAVDSALSYPLRQRAVVPPERGQPPARRPHRRSALTRPQLRDMKPEESLGQ